MLESTLLDIWALFSKMSTLAGVDCHKGLPPGDPRTSKMSFSSKASLTCSRSNTLRGAVRRAGRIVQLGTLGEVHIKQLTVRTQRDARLHPQLVRQPLAQGSAPGSVDTTRFLVPQARCHWGLSVGHGTRGRLAQKRNSSEKNRQRATADPTDAKLTLLLIRIQPRPGDKEEKDSCRYSRSMGRDTPCPPAHSAVHCMANPVF